MGFLTNIFNEEKRIMKQYEKKADEVVAYEGAMAALSDDELKAKTAEFKERLKNGETKDDILPEAFRNQRDFQIAGITVVRNCGVIHHIIRVKRLGITLRIKRQIHGARNRYRRTKCHGIGIRIKCRLRIMAVLKAELHLVVCTRHN